MMGSWASARAFAVLRHLKRLEEMLAYRGEAGIFQFHQGDGAGEGRGAYDLGGHREGGGLPAVYDGGRNHRNAHPGGGSHQAGPRVVVDAEVFGLGMGEHPAEHGFPAAVDDQGQGGQFL